MTGCAATYTDNVLAYGSQPKLSVESSYAKNLGRWHTGQLRYSQQGCLREITQLPLNSLKDRDDFIRPSLKFFRMEKP